VDVHFPDVAVQVAAGEVEELHAAVAHVHPDRVAIAAMKLLIDVHHRFHVVIAGRQRGELHRIARRGIVDHGRMAGRQLVEIHAENCRPARRDHEPRPRVSRNWMLAAPVESTMRRNRGRPCGSFRLTNELWSASRPANNRRAANGWPPFSTKAFMAESRPAPAGILRSESCFSMTWRIGTSARSVIMSPDCVRLSFCE